MDLRARSVETHRHPVERAVFRLSGYVLQLAAAPGRGPAGGVGQPPLRRPVRPHPPPPAAPVRLDRHPRRARPAPGVLPRLVVPDQRRRRVSTAREEILDRIRAAISPDTPGRAATPAQVDAAYAALPRDYRRAHHDAAGTDIVALFAERAADYRAVVERVPAADLPAAIARALADVPSFLVPDGLPPLAGRPGRRSVRSRRHRPAR